MRTIIATLSMLALAACGDPDADAARDGNGASVVEDLTPVDGMANGVTAPVTEDPAGPAALVRQTQQGGYVMGNPEATVKLVEYGSRTCPSCARFSAEAMKPLVGKYIASGNVSYEFRDLIIHGGPDIAAALVGRCSTPSRFFPILEATYAAQTDSLNRLATTPPAEQKAMEGASTQKALAWLADRAGYVSIARSHGVTASDAARCLADADATRKIIGITEAAKDVQATPTFIVNGKTLDAHDWKGVEAALKAAGA